MSPSAAASGMGSGLVPHLVRFGRALRGHGVGVGLSDEADALEAMCLVDLGDRDEVRRALGAAMKIRPRDAAAFDELFARWWSKRPPHEAAETPRPEQPRFEDPTRPPRPGPQRRPGPRLAGPECQPAPATAAAGASEVPAGEEPGYSPEALLRRKSFEECSAADLEAMEHLMARLALRLATRPSRRRLPARGAVRGEVDLRRSFRRALADGGELLSLARRRRAIELPRLVVLCDTSGSMDPHTRFLLAFVLALRRMARRCELFAFNTALVRLTPWLRESRAAPGLPGTPPAGWEIDRVLRRLAADVPGWSGGTRIGECLAAFAGQWLDELVDGRTVVLILSDGLDRGDVGPLVGAMRAIRGRARQVLWLNPLAGDRRYEPTARAMAAAMPYVDRLAPAHNLEALERLLPLLSA
ncbi:MAG TPA: VWA domain-containing protein [Thermoanaerobaculia bacterium]